MQKENAGERILGTDPKSGKPVSVRLGKFGPMAQIGAADDEEKTFASLLKEQNIGNITLEEVLNLFLLPKNLGIYKGEEVEVSNGRYGPFIRFGALFVSLPKGEEPLNVDLHRAQELIDEKLHCRCTNCHLQRRRCSKRNWSIWTFFEMEWYVYQCK